MTLRLISQLKFSTQLFNAANKLVSNTSSSQLARSFHTTLNIFGQPIQLKMPALSPTMTEGQIVKWHKKEGDKISPGDVLFEVQTDKAVMAFELEEEGVLAKILNLDQTKPVQVGSLVAIMVLPGDDWKSVQIPDGANSSTPSTSTSSSSQEQNNSHADDHDLKMGPAARNLIHLYNIDANKIKGTGPHGRILKRNYIDVKEFIEQNKLVVVAGGSEGHKQAQTTSVPPPPPPPSSSASTTQSTRTVIQQEDREIDYEDIELSNMRKVIAKRLLFSKTTIPHSYATSTCVVDKIVALRKEMIKNNQKVSINDFIIKAISLALRLVPELNSNYDESTGSFKQISTVDISVAVATDKGLITPIVKNADRLSVLEISEYVKNLADKARKNKLQPHEFQGGSFSISNLGMFGISNFTAVINPPQVGILAVGSSQSKFNSEMKPESHLSFSLSFDERCISMDRAIKFLSALSYFISNPALMNEASQF